MKIHIFVHWKSTAKSGIITNIEYIKSIWVEIYIGILFDLTLTIEKSLQRGCCITWSTTPFPKTDIPSYLSIVAVAWNEHLGKIILEFNSSLTSILYKRKKFHRFLVSHHKLYSQYRIGFHIFCVVYFMTVATQVGCGMYDWKPKGGSIGWGDW